MHAPWTWPLLNMAFQWSLPAKLEFQHKTVVGGPDYNLHFEIVLHHNCFLLLLAQHSLLCRHTIFVFILCIKFHCTVVYFVKYAVKTKQMSYCCNISPSGWSLFWLYQDTILELISQYIFIGPRCPWGPIYGFECLKQTDKLSYLFADLTDVTLADEDTNSILTDNDDRAFQGNLQLMHVTQPGHQVLVGKLMQVAPSGGQIWN